MDPIDIAIKESVGTINYWGTTYNAFVEMHSSTRFTTSRGESGQILKLEIWLADIPEPTWEDSYETP